MIKKISTILILLVFTGCANIQDKLPKRKACDGSKETLADLICKK